jgi:hypothetical protein
MSRLSVAGTTEAGVTMQVTPEHAKEPIRLYSHNGEGRNISRQMKRSTTVARRIRRAIEEVVRS